MPDKEPQRPSGRGEGGQGTRESPRGEEGLSSLLLLLALRRGSSRLGLGGRRHLPVGHGKSVMGSAALVPFHVVLGTQEGAGPDKAWPSRCAGEEHRAATTPRVRKAARARAVVNRHRLVTASSWSFAHLHKARDSDDSRFLGYGCLPMLGTGPGPSDSFFTGH